MVVGQDEARARAVLAEMLERLAGGPHHALGLSAAATADEVRAAFLQLTKTYHPARFGRLSIDTQKLSNEVFLGIRAAHDTLAKTARGGTRPSSAVGKLGPPPANLNRAGSSPPPPSLNRVGSSPPPRQASAAPVAPVGARGSQPTPSPRPGSGRHPQPAPKPAPTPAMGVPVQPTASGPRDKPVDTEAGVLELLQRGQWDAAHAGIAQLLARQPKSFRYRALLAYAKGRQAQLTGQRDEARVELENALQLDPDLRLAKTALGELFTRRK